MEQKVGTIAHINTGNNRSRGYGMAATMMAAAALVAAQQNPAAAAVMDRHMKKLFKTNLKVNKRNPVVRPQVKTFAELPKIEIVAVDIVLFKHWLNGIKAQQAATMFDIIQIYREEESVTEINEVTNWNNQEIAQFIHGAYTIIMADLQNLMDHVKENKKQQNNINTLTEILHQIHVKMNTGLIRVLSAPEAVNTVLSPEAVTALKEFEGLYRRINNITQKIEHFQKL